MSRSAVDATRFTAVSPRAFARSTPSYRASPSTLSPSRAPPSNPKARINPNAPVPPRPIDPKKGALGGAPPGETPLQKVARLRQVRLKERLAEMSRWDRVVMKGRVWADFAHRTTVVIILLFTVLIMGVASFSITDMVVQSRRKRRAFYAEQSSIYHQRLLEAIEVEQSGMPLSEDLASVLDRERAKAQALETKKQTSWRKSIRRFFTEDLKSDEEYEAERQARIVIESEESVLQRFGVDRMSILERVNQAERDAAGGGGPGSDNGREEDNRDGSGILQAVAEKRRQGEKAMEAAGVQGGPLDRIAEEAVQAAKETTQSAEEEKAGSSKSGWTTWWTGK